VVLLAEETRKAAASPVERAAVERTLLDLMNAVNAQLDPHEQIGFVVVAEGPWSVQNGLVTPTLKIKRNVLESRYRPSTGDWAGQNRPVIWEAPLEAARSAAS
jgi:long-subunit acyl-CoA synthetase (AMP-forming)